MLESVGGIVTIGCFLFLFVVFGLFAHKQAANASQASASAHESDHPYVSKPQMLHVQLVPTDARPWAELSVSYMLLHHSSRSLYMLQPMSTTLTPHSKTGGSQDLQVNFLIIMPTRRRLTIGPDQVLPELVLGSTQVRLNPPIHRC